MSPPRILVTAATRHGATMEIAEEIGAELRRAGLSVDTLPIGKVDGLGAYGSVVLGSAVYTGRWLSSALAFVDRHREEFAARRVWLFSSGPLGDPPKPTGPEGSDIVAMVAAIGARGHRTFPGSLDRHELGLVERAMAGLVKAPDGDYRPWPDIVAWADEIAAGIGEPPIAS